MTRLYRTADSSAADAIQNALEDIVIRHEVVLDPSDDACPDGIGQADLPVLEDDGDILSEADAIDARLDDLRQLMADWDRFQSDACYIEDDGSIC